MIGGRSQSIDVNAHTPKTNTARDNQAEAAGIVIRDSSEIKDYFLVGGPFTGLIAIIGIGIKYLTQPLFRNQAKSNSPAKDVYMGSLIPKPPKPTPRNRGFWSWFFGGRGSQALVDQSIRKEPAVDENLPKRPDPQTPVEDQRSVLPRDWYQHYINEIEAEAKRRAQNNPVGYRVIFGDLLREAMILDGQILFGPERDYKQGANDAVEMIPIIDVPGAEEQEPLRPKQHINPLADYLEMKGTYHLKDGDVLPGRAFDVTDPESFYRELLTINFGEDSRAYEVLEEAKRIGDQSHKQGRPIQEIANKIADMIQLKFADGQGHSIVENGKNQTVGLFYQEGGCCRHRSALLQMAFQVAGVPSRYIQGNLIGGGPHAWVEVDVKRDGTYSYVIDLNATARGEIIVISEKGGEAIYAVGNNAYSRDNSRNFNKVWRPKVAPEAGSSSHVRVEMPSIAEVRSQINADQNMYRELIGDALKNLPVDVKEALRDGVLGGDSSRHRAAEGEARRMERVRGRDRVSSPKESMRRGRARRVRMVRSK